MWSDGGFTHLPDWISPNIYSGGAAFDPSSLSGLIFWLNANNSGSITQSGGKVSQWNDLSSSGANFTQSTSVLQPSYIASAINGMPGVDFTGSKAMVNSTQFIGSGSSPRTIIVVSSFTTIPANSFSFLMTFLGTTNGNSPQLGYSTFSGYNNVFFGGLLTGTFGVVRTTAAFGTAGSYALTLTYNGSGPGAANYAWYNSNVSQTVSVGSDDSDTVSANVLGANRDTGSLSNLGPICEFIIYNRVLNSTELAQIQTYIHGKYAL